VAQQWVAGGEGAKALWDGLLSLIDEIEAFAEDYCAAGVD
jgi:hypothetical protein